MRALLASLVAMDLTLATFGFFLPDLWFRLFHGIPYDDPQGLLRRMGANWLAFAIFQAVALVKHERAPHWLAIVAGMRMGDMLTDWTYIAFSTQLTPLGWILLGSASPGNAALAIYLLRAYRSRTVASPKTP